MIYCTVRSQIMP